MQEEPTVPTRAEEAAILTDQRRATPPRLCTAAELTEALALAGAAQAALWVIPQ